MGNIEDRLVNCFSVVFPKLQKGKIRQAGTDNVRGWDSIASVTLCAVIQEEFGVDIPPDDLPELLSFGEIATYLQKKLTDN